MAIVAHLIADAFGTHIGKYSERLKVTCKGETLAQAPLMHLESVHILNLGISISADALAACCERGIPVFFLDGLGNPYASVYASGLAGTVITRREQLRAYDDLRGTALGLAFARGKILNQAATLKYLAKLRTDQPEGEDLKRSAAEVRDYLAALEPLTPFPLNEVRHQILSAEGNAARIYWQAVRSIVPSEYAWTERTGRGAIDPVNSLLNYGYGILYGQVERTLILAGLDPYAGYIHVDRPGKPSLVLDFIEEFRQVAVDRVVLGLLARRFTIEQDEQGRLSEATRQQFAEHILSHLEAKVRYEQQQHPLRQAMQMQARALAAFLRVEHETYAPFQASW